MHATSVHYAPVEMPRPLSSRPVRRLLRPVRRRLTAHTTRVVRSEVEPLKRSLAAIDATLAQLAARVGEYEQATAAGLPAGDQPDVSDDVRRLTDRATATEAAISELAGRVEALRYRVGSLDDSVT